MNSSLEKSACVLLDSLVAEKRLRTIPDDKNASLIDFLSNDYIGLAQNSSSFRAEFAERFGDAAMTSSASRLLSRDHSCHKLLERQLTDIFGKETLLFNSGYHANTGAVCALATLPRTLFVCDKLVHASIIDGLMIGKAEFKRFKHNDIESLKKILAAYAAEYDNVVCVVEGIYSMTGDCAPLAEIVALKKQYPNMSVYLDEAHSFGVVGDDGSGLASTLGLTEEVDIIVLTFGKALASAGATVVCSATLKKLMMNAARSFIFSTALPPAQCAWTSLMIEKMQTMSEERKHLRKLSKMLRTAIMEITGKESASESQIVPLVTGSAESAIVLAEKLRKQGFDVLPIRRPTVAPGQEGIRFSLSSSVTEQQMTCLINCLKQLLSELK